MEPELGFLINSIINDDEDESSSSSSSDIDTIDITETKIKRRRLKEYFEEIVPLYSENEFKTHFRISKKLFEELSNKFDASPEYEKIKWHYKTISARKHIALFLWFAGREDCSCRDVADRFELSLWTVHKIIHRVTNFISNTSSSVIRWPNDTRKKECMKYYSDLKKFPGIIGLLDTTHIIIDPPRNKPDDYIDSAGQTSICLQAVCDHNKKFIDIFVGYPGSVHHSEVLENSPLYSELQNTTEGYILGDSMFPCLKYLMVPYKDDENLTVSQKQFNDRLNTCRLDIEYTFGLLKQRFRQLRYCKLRSIETLCHFVRACCVLHNLADNDDTTLFEDPIEIIASEYDTMELDIAEDGQELRNQLREKLFDKDM